MTDRLDYALASLRRAAEMGYSFDVLPDEAAALVAEVDRLREESHTLRLWAEEAALAENLNAEDAKRERAAVVACLRLEYDVSPYDEMAAVIAFIERGEHRREEKR